MNNTIFVSVANYRDPETPYTVESLLDNAKYPDKITVGVFNQLNIPVELKYIPTRYRQLKQEVVSYKISIGVCWARNWILNNLLKFEDYTLQIDSHSRFIQDWDEVLLSQYSDLNDPLALLSIYPNGYVPPNNLTELNFQRMGLKGFDVNGIPEQHAVICSQERPVKPVLGAFCAGGCLFGPSHAFKRVPYDPYLYFLGEEITYALRLYTHGYNIYHPSIPFMWHYYNVGNVRPTHWQDKTDWFTLESRSRSRVKQLLGIENTRNITDMVDFHKYNLGNVRTLQQFSDFAGVNFKNQFISDNARRGIFS